MATRRAHHKTKTGCETCKKRRVKCDEHHPNCMKCTQRGLECTYSSPSAGKRSRPPIDVHVFHQRPTEPIVTKSASPSTPESNASTPTPLQPSTISGIIAHTGLLQGFSDVLKARYRGIIDQFGSVIAAVSYPPEAEHAWTNAIPVLGVNHPFVLHGMISISSLYMSHQLEEDNDDKSIYHDIAVEQMTKGLARYRIAVQNVTDENAEALFAFSTTMAIYTLVTSGEEYRDHWSRIHHRHCTPESRMNTFDTMILSMLKMFRFLRGQSVILVPCWHRLTQGILSPITDRSWWPYAVPANEEAAEEGRRLQALERMWMRTDRVYEYHFDALIEALRRLRETFALVSQLESRLDDVQVSSPRERTFDNGALIGWSTRMPQDFLSLLDRRIPEAWVIVAHYGMLVHRRRKFWLFDTWPSTLVALAAHIVTGEERKYLEWPAQETGVDLHWQSASVE